MNGGMKNIQYEASSASSLSPISHKNNEVPRISRLGQIIEEYKDQLKLENNEGSDGQAEITHFEPDE